MVKATVVSLSVGGAMQEDTKYILEGVTQLVPSLKAAEVVGAWVGLRPVRPSARLEPETLQVLTGPRPTTTTT
jgi:glycerol-3-phosphate dehydrogenase